MTTELRCIEGWSEVVHWAGARLADLASATGLATRGGRPFGYAALQTPDGNYYVGLDMASALHPQTLLCYEMDGRPLTPEHGRRSGWSSRSSMASRTSSKSGPSALPTCGQPTTGPNAAMTGMQGIELTIDC